MLKTINAVLKSKKIKYFYYGICSLVSIIILSATIAYHFFLIPNVENYKQNIESFIAKETGGEVSIDKLNIVWNITNPWFQLRNFSITDKDNNKTIHLNAIDFEISWLSILKFEPILNQIIIGDLDILVERTVNNKLKIAGIEIIESSESSLSDWLLNQHEVRIINGKITWRDQYRAARDLIISGINFTYSSPTYLTYLDRHKFNLNALLSEGTKDRIYANGFFDLDSIDHIDQIKTKMKVNISQAFLPSFKPWIDYPFDVKQGYGDLKLNLAFVKNEIQEIKTSFNIENYIGNFNDNQDKYIHISELSGNAIFDNSNNEKKIASTNLNFKTNNIDIKNSAFEIKVKDNLAQSFKLKLNKLNIDAAEIIINQTPFLEGLKSYLDDFSPTGDIQNLKLSWEKNKELIAAGSLINFGISSHNEFPGFNNLSASFDIKNNRGFIDIASKNITINQQDKLRTNLIFDSLNGLIKLDGDNYKFTNLLLNNNDLNFLTSGTVNLKNLNKPNLDLTINVSVPDISRIKKYYPKNTDPDLLNWLDTSLLAGSIEKSKITIKGQLDKLFDKNTKSILQISGSFNNANIEYATGYPEIEKANILFNLDSNILRLLAKDGTVADQNISTLEVISDLSETDLMINAHWITSGGTNNLIQAINNSPLYEDTKEFTNQLITTGDASLDLKINLPIMNPDEIDFDAKYKLNDINIQNPRIGLPQIKKLNGILFIKPNFYELKNASGSVFEMPINVSVLGENNLTKINATGTINEKFFIDNLGSGWINKVQGSAEWILKSNITEESNSLSLETDLKGIEINGPQPLNKKQGEVKVLSIVKKPTKNKSTDYIIRLDNDVNGKVYMSNNGWSGQINILSNEEFQDRNGLSIFANFKDVDLDDFSSLINLKSDNRQETFRFGKSKINFEKLAVNGFNLNQLETVVFPSNNSLKVSLYSNEIKGNALWNNNERKLTGRFNKFIFSKDKQIGKLNDEDNLPTTTEPLSIDLMIDEVILNEKSMGKFDIQASNINNQIWKIENFTVTNPHHEFIADGEWQAKEIGTQTKMDFKWKVDNLEKTLEQLGYPNLVKKGNARFNGIANWEGSPFDFSSPLINGNFSMDIQKGEILEAEPGIGRLFGLLTLQNLPKRLSLDFSDLFSKGFIFDSINAGVRINSGVLSSNNFKMIGPAAEVLMDGEVDIIEETQNLHVTVKPYVSDSLSLAALAGGPLVGAAAFIAQKILKDPLNKVMTDEYQIIGTWDDPIEIDKPKSEELSELVDEEVIQPSESILQKLNIFKNKNE